MPHCSIIGITWSFKEETAPTSPSRIGSWHSCGGSHFKCWTPTHCSSKSLMALSRQTPLLSRGLLLGGLICHFVAPRKWVVGIWHELKLEAEHLHLQGETFWIWSCFCCSGSRPDQKALKGLFSTFGSDKTKILVEQLTLKDCHYLRWQQSRGISWSIKIAIIWHHCLMRIVYTI